MAKNPKPVPAGPGLFEIEDDQVRELWDELTCREQELAGFFAKGITNRIIAETVGISAKTLDIHRGNLCRKLRTKPWGIARVYFAAKQLGLPYKEKTV